MIGYEQERLSGIKSDSQFPFDAINEILRNVESKKIKGCTVYISNWFDRNDFSKYMALRNSEWLENTISPSSVIFTNENGFTHHDAHACSAYSFFKYNLKEEQKSHSPLHIIVADGFGNNQEVLSIYETDCTCKKEPKLIHRAYNYMYSLGLFYQYATSFVGMKELQDEYKFLGYESKIDEVVGPESIDAITGHADLISSSFAECLLNCTTKPEAADDIINKSALKNAKSTFYDMFSDLLVNKLGFDDNVVDCHSIKARVCIAFFIQSVVEKTMERIIKEFSMRNVCVAGGLFYNVKLNNSILKHIDGLFCAMPLAGDQGAAIGMLEHYARVQFPFNTLAIGKRNFYNADKVIKSSKFKDGITFLKYSKSSFELFRNSVVRQIAKDIADNKLVNIIFNNMEFGPRALCNTSTMFLPSRKNASLNNIMNGRNNVMPFAPVCTEENAYELFYKSELDRVVGSDYFMICTHKYKLNASDIYAGAMHKIPMSNDEYTGRPQIVHKGTFTESLLNELDKAGVKCLVNTSFNVHGNPIVFNMKQIVDNFNYQCEQIGSENVKLYIISID